MKPMTDSTQHASLDTLLLRDYHPRSQVRVPSTERDRSAVPCIDVHNHLGRWLLPGGWMAPDVSALLETMDSCDVQTVVNLDGRWGPELSENVARLDAAHPGRFVTFCHFDWSVLARPGGFDALPGQLREAVERGARGIKVWKDLGLTHRDAAGELVLPDDPRLDEAFDTAGELGLPVLIHTADPIAFFEPLDAHNERLEELAENPDWWFGGPGMPTFDRLIDALAGRAGRSPGTTFVAAHVGGCAEDLGRVTRMLDEHPNLHVDTGGRMAELGRQPRAFRRLVERHPDRVVFGTDAFPVASEDYRLWFRFLETDDEAFEYAPGEDVPPQGRWAVSAVDLPAALLPGVYHDNAARFLGLA
jgi:predicted TIM-barrel fold metal-dependent hydrolase